MSLEVELKYSVDNEQQFLASLAQLPVREGVTQRQVDHYFNHPERDFAATDEAFRIRIEGAEACLTYKGPKLDAETKTRREVEVPLLESGTAADRAFEMLCSLGFKSLATVSKLRTTYHLVWQDRDVTLTIDLVDQVGSFVECELVVSESEFSQAKKCLLSLVSELGLKNPLQTSYLEMLLHRREEQNPESAG